MSVVPEVEEIAAALAEIRHQAETCQVCNTARQQRRNSGVRLRAWLRLCAEFGDPDNTCPACIAASDQHLATGWDEIRIRASHPHTRARASRRTRTAGG